MIIIDRRKNTQDRSVGNRQRVLSRAKEAVRQAAVSASEKRSINSNSPQKIVVQGSSLDEPFFSEDFVSGKRNIVLSGNKEYIVGDRIGKDPDEAKGSGGVGGQGDGEDATEFLLNLDEYLDLVFDGLELPHLTKTSLAKTEVTVIEHSGISHTGSPSNLSVLRSLKHAKGRRIGLGRPTDEQIAVAQESVNTAAEEDKPKAEEALQALLAKRKNIPWLDPFDLRYNHYEPKPKPIAKAVVFFILDVSGSMNHERRMLAKRLFLLTATFLHKNYKHLDIVFICHADGAEEVDEKDFFYGHKSGGTVISSALNKMLEIQKERFSANDYNIYVAQASDGDNFEHDNKSVEELMTKFILPITQFFIYAEVANDSETSIWRIYDKIAETHDNFISCEIAKQDDIYPVFRSIFRKAV